jgi:hypothetical protein
MEPAPTVHVLGFRIHLADSRTRMKTVTCQYRGESLLSLLFPYGELTTRSRVRLGKHIVA